MSEFYSDYQKVQMSQNPKKNWDHAAHSQTSMSYKMYFKLGAASLLNILSTFVLKLFEDTPDDMVYFMY